MVEMFEYKNEQLVNKENKANVFLEQFLNSEDIQEFKNLFGENFEFVKDIKIEVDPNQDNDNYNFKINKIFLKEKNVDKSILIHELHHALIENKYHIFELEDKIYDKFNITEKDISEVTQLTNKELSEQFIGAHDYFNKISKKFIYENIEKRLISAGKNKEEVIFKIDFLKTEKMLEALRRYRKFFFLTMEQRFGKQAADCLKILSEIHGEDEIIARAIEWTHETFSLDMISYKNFNIKNGSLDIYKTKQCIKKDGYSVVLDKTFSKRIEAIENIIKQTIL